MLEAYPLITQIAPPALLAVIAGLISWNLFRLGRASANPPVESVNAATVEFPLADLDAWRQTDPLLLWQAGCLWKGISPAYPVKFLNPAYPSFSMLLRAAEHDEIELVKKEPPPDLAFSHITRDELFAFAEKKGEIPEFLRTPHQYDAWAETSGPSVSRWGGEA